jgi:hypothetical protein
MRQDELPNRRLPSRWIVMQLDRTQRESQCQLFETERPPPRARGALTARAEIACGGGRAFPVPLVLLEIKRDWPAAVKPKLESRKAAGEAAVEATLR